MTLRLSRPIIDDLTLIEIKHLGDSFCDIRKEYQFMDAYNNDKIEKVIIDLDNNNFPIINKYNLADTSFRLALSQIIDNPTKYNQDKIRLNIIGKIKENFVDEIYFSYIIFDTKCYYILTAENEIFITKSILNDTEFYETAINDYQIQYLKCGLISGDFHNDYFRNFFTYLEKLFQFNIINHLPLFNDILFLIKSMVLRLNGRRRLEQIIYKK